VSIVFWLIVICLAWSSWQYALPLAITLIALMSIWQGMVIAKAFNLIADFIGKEKS
jgi:hypothetical protein